MELIKNQRYPNSAKLYGIEGDVIVKVTLNRQGFVIAHELVEEAESQVLNQAVHEMIANISPLPAAPDNYAPGDEELTFIFPVAFRMKESEKSLYGIDKRFKQAVKNAFTAQ